MDILVSKLQHFILFVGFTPNLRPFLKPSTPILFWSPLNVYHISRPLLTNQAHTSTNQSSTLHQQQFLKNHCQWKHGDNFIKKWIWACQFFKNHCGLVNSKTVIVKIVMAACIHHVYFKIVVVGEYTLFSVSSFSLSHPNSLWIHHSCVVHCHPPSWSSIAEALWTPLKTSTMTPLKAQSIIQWTMTSLNHWIRNEKP